MIGQSIAQYKIAARIGEDAAGILYKAVDTKLERAVAIWILSSQGAANAQLRDRLIRDSTAVSALGHPNIAKVCEWSRQDAIEFAVMEAPEGESLYDFLERERPRRRNLLVFASGIASALGAAHGAGVVHGPFNPSAIFVSATSKIKIFDFGFGVLAPPPGAAAPYVSPEQVQGGLPDVRSDIFSYGALVYHLTTGRRPFGGAMGSEMSTAIVQNEPKPIAQITSRAPRGMDKLIERCMRKSPQRRFQTIAELEPLLERMADAYRQNPEHQASLLSRNRGWIAKGAGIALIAALAVAGILRWRSRPQAEPLIGTHIRQLTHDAGLASDPAISADGTRIAYSADKGGGSKLDIWVQAAAGGEAMQVTQDQADDREPSFSPDGAAIVFRSERNGGGIYVVPSKGGAARLIAPDGRRPRYSPDGRWIAYWVGPPGLSPKADGAYKTFIIPSGGGEPKQIAADFASSTYPVWSPDSKRVLFLGRPDATRIDPGATDWWVASVEGHSVSNTGACAFFHRIGVGERGDNTIPGDWKGNNIFYSIPRPEGSNIWMAEISPASLTVERKPVRVTNGSGIQVMPSGASNGTLVFASQSFNADIWSIPALTGEGKVTGELKRITNDPGADVCPSVSSDGAKLVFQSDRSGHYNVMMQDGASGKATPVAPGPEDQLWPIISPDGSKIGWSEMRLKRFEHLYKPAGGGPTGVLCESCGPAVSAWSRDGREALVDAFDEAGTRLAVGVATPGGGKPALVLKDAGSDLHQARFSPDDRWIAFVARFDGGSTKVYVAPYHDQAPTPASQWIALTDGSAWESSPHWSPEGKLVYYISTRDGFRCVWAQRLVEGGRPSGPAFAVYHLHAARLTPASLPFNSTDLYVGRNEILLSLGELTGNIWSARIKSY